MFVVQLQKESTVLRLFYYYREKNCPMKISNAYVSSKDGKQRQEINLSIKLPLYPNQASIHLSFNQFNPQLQEAARSQRTHKPILPRNEHRIVMQSANVSREKIEVEEETANKNIQFNKQHKNRLKNLHKRTRSNYVELGMLKDDQLSNFSNSLQNISQEIIEIPFARKVITPSNSVKRFQNGQARLKSFISSGKTSCRGSLEKRVGSPSMKISFQRKSIQRIKNKQNKENRFDLKYRSQQKTSHIPRPKQKVQQPLSLSDFNLKAIKITEGGSIVYLGVHRATNALFAIKSIKKRLIKPIIQSFILQIKLGLLLSNPNVAKIYGFFSDRDNFYIVKEYLQQGCITQHKKRMNENDIGCDINQILNGIISTLPVVDSRYWSIDAKNISLSHGICKITTIKVNLSGTSQSFSQKLKHCLLYLLQNDRKSENMKDIFDTNDSIHLNMLRNGSYLLANFREMVESILIITENEILMLWQAHFLRQYRFKSLMQEQK